MTRLICFQGTPETGYIVAQVGEWDKATESLLLDDNLFWNLAESDTLPALSAPESLCSKPCAPGQYRLVNIGNYSYKTK